MLKFLFLCNNYKLEVFHSSSMFWNYGHSYNVKVNDRLKKVFFIKRDDSYSYYVSKLICSFLDKIKYKDNLVVTLNDDFVFVSFVKEENMPDMGFLFSFKSEHKFFGFRDEVIEDLKKLVCDEVYKKLEV